MREESLPPYSKLLVDVSNVKHAPRWVPLFYARPAEPREPAPCVSVCYDGVKYVIPADDGCGNGEYTGRSMHVLSLVSQLIGLQKKSEAVPGTSAVTVIGQ